MEKILLFKKLIVKYTSLDFLRKVFCWLAKIIALVIVVYGLYVFVDNWTEIGGAAEAIIYMIIHQLIWLFLFYLLLHIWWMKGVEICAMKDKDYVMMPVVSVYLRGVGESMLVFSILMSLSAMIRALFMNLNYGDAGIPLLLEFSTRSSFLWSLILLVNGILVGIILIGFFYLLAELFAVWLEIARNTRKK